jgi:hypothetical protein
MSVDRTIIYIVIISDDISHEGLPFHEPMSILSETEQDREFGLREGELIIIDMSYEILRIDRDLPEVEMLPILLGLERLRPLHDRRDTSDELSWAKWL